MRVWRAVQTSAPEDASAQLLEFLRDHPKSTLKEVMLALELPESTAYYALTRLRDLGWIRKVSRWLPARWRLATIPPEASCTCREVADFTTGPPLVQTDGVVRPTGTLVALAGGLQIIGIEGPRMKEPEYSHESTAHEVGAFHPWSYARSNWQSMAKGGNDKKVAGEGESLGDVRAGTHGEGEGE